MGKGIEGGAWGNGWKLQPSLRYKAIEDIRKDFKPSSQDFDLACKGILSGSRSGVLALSLCLKLSRAATKLTFPPLSHHWLKVLIKVDV